MSKNLPSYLVKILALEAAGKIPRGVTSFALVVHDDTCPLLVRAGPCACDPEVTFDPDRTHGADA